VSRIMLDGINSDAAAMAKYKGPISFVAGYVDGLYKWSAANWALFPNSVHIRIAVFSTTNDGHVLDCEPGNADPAQSVDWVLMRRKAGVDPTVYCGRNTWWSAIRDAFSARNVPQPHYWVADYSGDPAHPVIPAGAVALQYADAGAYDLSVVADYWPGVDSLPVGPVPTILGGPVYLISVHPDPTLPAGPANTGSGIFAVHEGLGPVHVDGPTFTPAFQQAHGPVSAVSPVYYAALVDAAAASSSVVQVDAAAADLIGGAIVAKLPSSIELSGTLK
jgi:hypothetical protein